MSKPESLSENFPKEAWYDGSVLIPVGDIPDEIAAHHKMVKVEVHPETSRAYIAALENLADQAARYIDTIVRPNETTQTLSSQHLWARGLEIHGEIRALLKSPMPVTGGKEG